jgi:Family of unknown function (DUF6496)
MKKVPTTKVGKQDKMGTCMHEFKQGTLHSGKGGPIVTERNQAQAICLRVSGQSRKR